MDIDVVPCPGYCKSCCYEHWGACIFLNYGFLWVYAQEWDCWVLLLVTEGLFLIAVCRWHTSLLLTFHGQGLSNTAIPNFQGGWYLWGSRTKEKQVWWASSQGLSWDVTKITCVLRGRAEMQTRRSLPLWETSTRTHKAKVLLVKEENYTVECKVYVVIWKKK